MLFLVMCQAAILVFLLAGVSLAQQTGVAPRKVAGAAKPVCSPQAICFSGKVSAGEDFRKNLTDDLAFVLQPGWTIAIVPKHPERECQEFASVANAPYRAHRALYIDTSYGWTAEDEVSTSPREFRFVTNCADYRTESDRLTIVMWPYAASDEKYQEALAKLGTLARGTGRLWITGSQTSHAEDTAANKLGKIEWMTFTVEIRLPASK